MPKRISDEERIEHYFRNADEMAATGTLRVAKAILNVRFGPQVPVDKPKRGRPKQKIAAVTEQGAA